MSASASAVPAEGHPTMHRPARTISRLLAVILCATMNSASAAPEKRPGFNKRHSRSHVPPRKAARPQTTSCAEFGPGFMRMQGSDSCIRFNGGVGMGVGAVP